MIKLIVPCDAIEFSNCMLRIAMAIDHFDALMVRVGVGRV